MKVNQAKPREKVVAVGGGGGRRRDEVATLLSSLLNPQSHQLFPHKIKIVN